MKPKRYPLVIAAFLLGVLLGGTAVDRFLTDRPADARPSSEPAKIIAAEQFLVVDKDGKPKAKLPSGPTGGRDCSFTIRTASRGRVSTSWPTARRSH